MLYLRYYEKYKIVHRSVSMSEQLQSSRPHQGCTGFIGKSIFFFNLAVPKYFKGFISKALHALVKFNSFSLWGLLGELFVLLLRRDRLEKFSPCVL